MVQGNAFQLCILFGTPVYLTGSYFLLLLFLSWRQLAAGRMQEAFLFAFAVTASLMVHEFGHVFAAKRNGFQSRVVFVGLGAVTIPNGESKGWSGVLLSVAGPAAGFLLALIMFYGFGPANQMPFLDYVLGNTYANDGTLWPYLQLVFVKIGVFWSIFNLMPILPMDGGHALRDFLCTFMRSHKATAIASRVSVGVSVPLAIWLFQVGFVFGALLVGFMAWQNFESLSQNR